MLDMLEMLKVDLGIVTSAYDTRLTQYISYAKQSIMEEGAVLDLSSVADMQLVVMYAGWLWRRRDTGEGMPRMLRYALNNKVLGGKANG
jgi:hypothetical protein